MESKVIYTIAALFLLTIVTDCAFAYSCEMTVASNNPNEIYHDQVNLADCRIETQTSKPFNILPGDYAKFTAEQEIRLRPGFHANKGSHFQTHFRGCIRNPDNNTGYASWGNYDLNTTQGEMWMKRVAERFVDNFNTPSNPQLTVQLKYTTEDTSIPDFYRDSTMIMDGNDDAVTGPEHGGIDEGVFFFHVGHGRPWRFHVRSGDIGQTVTEIRDDPQEVLLGNCTRNP